MDSFDLLPSLADGELAESSAPELVAAIFRSRASGTLTIDAPESGEVRQFFRAGQMCGSGYFNGFFTLAQVLLEQEWAQALDVDESLAEAQAQGRRHGELLLEKGLLTPEQLAQALGAQHRHNLMALMRLDRGHYELRGWEPPPSWTRELNIDPLGPLFDALEEPRLIHRRAHLLDWLGANPVQLTSDWAEMAPRAQIGALDHRAISQLAVARTREEFLSSSRLKPARAEALITGLLLIGAAEPKEGAGEPARSAPPERIATPPPQQAVPPQPRIATPPPQRTVPPQPRIATSSPQRSIPPPHRIATPPPSPRSAPPGTRAVPPQGFAPPDDEVEILATVSGGEEPAFESSALDSARLRAGQRGANPELDESSLPEAVLASNPGVEKDAPPEPPRARPAQHKPVTASRPPPKIEEEIILAMDEALQQGPRGFERDFGSVDEEAPSRALAAQEEEVVILADNEAFAIDSPSVAGAEVRKKLRARGLRNVASAAREPSPELELELGPEKPAAKSDDAPASREALRFLDEVRARVRSLPAQNPWQRLGVSRKASNEQIHAAYLEGVKRYHPDRASALGLTGVQDDLRVLFAAIQEAHEKIGTAAARERYSVQSTSSPGGGASPRQEEATLALKMGEVLLRKRDFAGAMIKLRRATELDPSGDTLAALAWGLLCDPSSSQAHRSEAEMLIDRALRVGGATARTHYVAGVSWRQRDPGAAGEAFRKALELDPNHRAASQELRLLELRQSRHAAAPAAPKPGGPESPGKKRK